MAEITKPIGTGALAKKLGVHQSTAWRKLRRIRDQRGDQAVTQEAPGRPLRTSIRALKDADPHLVELRELEREEIEAVVAARFRTRIAAQEKRATELEDKVKSLELQVKELLETASTLLRGVQILAKQRA